MKYFGVNAFMVSAFFLSGCASPETRRSPADAGIVENKTEIALQTRDEIYGVNRARISNKKKIAKEYVFRNIASAFPDTGKNMMIKDRSFSKTSVTGAIDHSPWRSRIYENPEHQKKDKSRFSIANKSLYANPKSQKEATANLLAKKQEPGAEPFYQTGSFGTDDAFEPNNSRDQAVNLKSLEDHWLGNLGSEGIQWDDDWYQVWVSPQYRRLVVDLRFQHYLGDIDFKLYDSKGEAIALSQGVVDDEYINVILEKGGVYYVQVFGSNRGNRYDFKYSTFFTGGGDDEYEDNDQMRMAYDLRAKEGQWLSEVNGEGVAADDDYYLVHLKPGKTRILVDLRVLVSKGDVDVRVLSTDGKIVASSSNIGDDDYIDFTVSTPGVYYLKVYPFNPSTAFNMYDLRWQSVKPSTQMATADASR